MTEILNYYSLFICVHVKEKYIDIIFSNITHNHHLFVYYIILKFIKPGNRN